jgi:hypothetical protein
MNLQDIVVLEEAAQDLLDSKAFYENQTQGIGNYFWDSLLSDIESLHLYAGIHEQHFGLFRMLSKRFPFAIYYAITNNIAYIIAILPTRRNPDWIMNRLGNP